MTIVPSDTWCAHLDECNNRGACIRLGDDMDEECRCFSGFSGVRCEKAQTSLPGMKNQEVLELAPPRLLKDDGSNSKNILLASRSTVPDARPGHLKNLEKPKERDESVITYAKSKMSKIDRPIRERISLGKTHAADDRSLLRSSAFSIGFIDKSPLFGQPLVHFRPDLNTIITGKSSAFGKKKFINDPDHLSNLADKPDLNIETVEATRATITQHRTGSHTSNTLLGKSINQMSTTTPAGEKDRRKDPEDNNIVYNDYGMDKFYYETVSSTPLPPPTSSGNGSAIVDIAIGASLVLVLLAFFGFFIAKIKGKKAKKPEVHGREKNSDVKKKPSKIEKFYDHKRDLIDL